MSALRWAIAGVLAFVVSTPVGAEDKTVTLPAGQVDHASLEVEAGTIHFATGDDLFSWLTGSPDDLLRGTQYILGAVDGLSESGVVRRLGSTPFQATTCLPRELTVRQFASIVRQYVGHHPEARERGAASLVGQALAEKYPCPARPG